MLEFSPTIAALSAALADAQGKLRPAAKDSNNPHFKSKYADLASVWDACRDALASAGLAVAQGVHADGALVGVTTVLLHKSGEWVRDTLTVTAQQNTPQGVGSCITYARRYGLAAMVGVAPDDDDAEAGSRKPVQVVAAPAARQLPAPAPAPDPAIDQRTRYEGMRAALVKMVGEIRTRVLIKEATAAATDGTKVDRELVLTKMREAIAEEERQHPSPL